MKYIRTLFLAAVVLATAPFLDAQIAVGDQPNFTFQQTIFNGMGAHSLADFRGKPLLIDFWGTR